MRRARKILSLLVAAAIGFGVLSGCSSLNTSGETDELIYYVYGTESKDTSAVITEINKILKEETGITVTFKFLESSNYDLVLSSGEKYDLITAPDWLQYWKNAENGAFAEITDEDLKKYAPYIYENGQKYIDATKYEGKRYGIPALYEYSPDRCLVARGDLMDKYGIEALNNMDDVERYLDAISQNEKDIIPFDIPGSYSYMLLSMWASDWGWASPGSLSFGEHVYFSLDDPDRKLFIAAEQPEMKEFSHKMKQWRDKGFFSKSVLSNKTEIEESFKNGRSALAWSTPERCNTIYNEFKGDERAQWDVRFYPMYSKRQRMYNYLNSVAAVSAFSENKDKALKVLDEFYSNEELYHLLTYGFKGVHYDVDENGKKITLDKDSYTSMSSGIKSLEHTLQPKLDFPGADELVAKLESMRVFDPIINCNMDNPSLREIDLALDEIYKTNTVARYFGVVDDPDKAIEEELKALKNAGIDTYVEAMQKRVDEYAKNLK